MSGKKILNPVTGPQQAVLDFIASYTTYHGFPPTTRELAAHFGWKNQSGARCHLDALRFKGLVTWQKGKARTLAVVPQLTQPNQP